MRRVLLTVHKFFPEHRAGTEVLTLKIAKTLQKKGYAVLVVTAAPPDVDARHKRGEAFYDYEYEGIPVHCLGEPLRLKNYTFRHEFHHPEIGAHFATVLDSFQPDLVHIMHAQNLSASIIDESRKRQIPVVCSATDFWFVCPVVQLKRPDGQVCRGPSPGALNCLTCYTPHLIPPRQELVEALERRSPALKNWLTSLPKHLRYLSESGLSGAYLVNKLPAAIQATMARPRVLRDAANRTQGIMVPTQLMKNIFMENGIHANLIKQVAFGIDVAPLAGYQEKQPGPELRIGFIGTFFEHKGPDLLIEAFLGLPPTVPAILKLYGALDQFPEFGHRLKNMVNTAKHNGHKIQFCGTFPNDQLGSVLQELDVLVVPSRWYENTPLVIQSALATKTPLIATNLGGMAELIHHEFNGLLFELNSAASLRQQLTRLIEDRSFLQQLTNNIKPERTIEEMVNDIESVYNSVLAAPPAHATIAD